MPFVLFLLGAAAVALVASQAKASPKGGGGRTYTLDANLPPQLRQQVLAALATEKDPQKLYTFAAQLVQSGYPLSALALTQRAAQLGGTPPWPLPAPQPSPAPAPAPSPSGGQVNPVDPNQLPDPPRTQVLAALTTGTDPGALLQLAAQMDAQGYSYAAAALRMKATVLQSMPHPAPAPVPSPSPMPPPGVLPGPAPSPAPQPSPSPSPSPFALDPGMPPQMQSAVLGALTTETDPVKLAAFAQAIQAQYPIAAGLLMTKALALRGGPVPPGPAPQPQPGPLGAPNTAIVTTHDPPPLGDLIVFDRPNGKKIGGADKSGTVTVLQWNADGANTWAQIAWAGGRNAATTGYVHQAYLSPVAGAQPMVAARAPSTALVRKGAANGKPAHA